MFVFSVCSLQSAFVAPKKSQLFSDACVPLGPANATVCTYTMAKELPLFQSRRQSTDDPYFAGLPTFSWDELSQKEMIGQGGFGSVCTAKRRSGEVVVVKKLLRNHERERRLFLKEAKILNSISNEHIVQLIAVCRNPVAIMLEYLYFDYSPFRIDHRASSLQDFLDFASTDDEYAISFSCLHVKIAEDVTLGLKYLHEKNIVHMDLKPANVLVSNQHYCDLDQESVQEAWKGNNGIVCKLVDFGESRSSVQQTATLCHTMTNNVDRGTIVFMAPELMSAQPEKALSLADLKKCDIWSLGMIIFMLLNPDLQYPYQLELDQLQDRSFEGSKKHLTNRLLQKEKPSFSSKYSPLQATSWLKLNETFEECTHFETEGRPSVTRVAELLQADESRSISRDILLSVSQSTAVECHDRLVAVGAAAPGDIVDDATNSCALLAVGIADQLLDEGRIERGMELSQRRF